MSFDIEVTPGGPRGGGGGGGIIIVWIGPIIIINGPLIINQIIQRWIIIWPIFVFNQRNVGYVNGTVAATANVTYELRVDGVTIAIAVVLAGQFNAVFVLTGTTFTATFGAVIEVKVQGAADATHDGITVAISGEAEGVGTMMPYVGAALAETTGTLTASQVVGVIIVARFGFFDQAFTGYIVLTVATTVTITFTLTKNPGTGGAATVATGQVLAGETEGEPVAWTSPDDGRYEPGDVFEWTADPTPDVTAEGPVATFPQHVYDVTDLTAADISRFFAGNPAANQAIFVAVAATAIIINATDPGYAFARTAPAGNISFDIIINAVGVGTVDFTTGVQAGTVTWFDGTNVEIAVGTTIEIASTAADGSIADISIVLKAEIVTSASTAMCAKVNAVNNQLSNVAQQAGLTGPFNFTTLPGGAPPPISIMLQAGETHLIDTTGAAPGHAIEFPPGQADGQKVYVQNWANGGAAPAITLVPNAGAPTDQFGAPGPLGGGVVGALNIPQDVGVEFTYLVNGAGGGFGVWFGTLCC